MVGRSVKGKGEIPNVNNAIAFLHISNKRNCAHSMTNVKHNNVHNINHEKHYDENNINNVKYYDAHIMSIVKYYDVHSMENNSTMMYTAWTM